MTLCEELYGELNAAADPKYAAFQRKLLKNDRIEVLGVRLPVLRKLAKKYKDRTEELFSLPDDDFEATFVKLQAAALLPYERFIAYADRCVALIDNWASCDSFAPACIRTRKREFLPHIFRYLGAEGGATEFSRRFALTTLLHFYVEEEYLPDVFDAVRKADTQAYYVHMAAAWLIAETLVKFYGEGVAFLQASAQAAEEGRPFLDAKTHNKAIQKARESFRLSEERKEFLRGLKRKA